MHSIVPRVAEGVDACRVDGNSVVRNSGEDGIRGRRGATRPSPFHAMLWCTLVAIVMLFGCYGRGSSWSDLLPQHPQLTQQQQPSPLINRCLLTPSTHTNSSSHTHICLDEMLLTVTRVDGPCLILSSHYAILHTSCSSSCSYIPEIGLGTASAPGLLVVEQQKEEDVDERGMDGHEAVRGMSMMELGGLDSNINNINSSSITATITANHNTIDGADSVHGSSTPVHAGKEGDEASRFVFDVVDAAVTHPNDAVVGENVDGKVAVQETALPAEPTDDGEQGIWGAGLFIIFCCVGICTVVRSAHPLINTCTLSLPSICLVNKHSLSHSFVRSVFATSNDVQREIVLEREALSRLIVADLDRYLPHLDAKKNRLRNGDSTAGSMTGL